MKKLLSGILVLAMLVSLAPAAFAADAEPGLKIVYDFRDEVTMSKATEYTNGTKTGVEIDPTLFTYAASNGFWEYAANSQNFEKIQSVNGTGVRIHPDYNAFQVVGGATIGKFWMAFKIYVPKSGTYNLSTEVNYAGNKANIYLDAYIFKPESVASAGKKINDKIVAGIIEDNQISTDAFPKADANTTKTLTFQKTMTLDEGEYYFVFNPTSNTGENVSYLRLFTLTLTEGDGSLTVPVISELTATTNDGVTTVSATAAKMSDNTDASGVTYSYSVAEDDAKIASVDANGVVTGLADGKATIIATATKNGQSASKSIEVAVTAPVVEPEEDKELTDAFDDAVVSAAPNDYIAPSVDAIDAEGIIGEPIKTSDGAYRITAPETADERGSFLYWKKAMTVNEKIISFDREFDYVPESEGRNILVAVYEGDVTSTNPKCYNANGQYLPNTTPTDGDLPSMAGYGKAASWEQYGKTNVYVAQYEATSPIADIDVTVTGDNTSGGGKNLAYGEEVTCTATGDNFKYWKKTYGDGTAKIVSVEKTYSFNAWEDCTVEAIYADGEVTYSGNTVKIIIDSFVAGSENGVMAEFVGFGANVVEKGIMFNGARIAMTTKGNQFSVIADKEGTYKGYAIIRDDDGLKLITDGVCEYTK